MSVTNTWSVVKMDAYPEVDGKTDVVFNVHWTLTGTDGTHFGSVYGSQHIGLDADASFTPHAELTEAQVVGWVKSAMGEAQVADYEANVAKQIEDQINPPTITAALPWSE